MATIFSVLQDLSDDRFKSIEQHVNECLHPLFSNDGPLGSTEAKGYGNFAVKFLHVSVTKLKTLKDITSVCELVRAIERCCACYLRVQDELSLDDEFYLPKLVFHVLNSVKHKSCVGEAMTLGRHMFSFLSQKQPLSASGEKITQSLFCCLWNIANTLGPQKENQISIDVVLQVRRCALMLASLLPNKTLLTERLEETLLNVASFNRDCKDKVKVETINKLSTEIVSDILKQLKHTGDNSEISLVYIRVVSLYMEHLIKTGNLETLEQECIVISSDLDSVVTDTKRILKILVYLYRLAAQIKNISTNKGNSLEAEINPVLKKNSGKLASHKNDKSSHCLNGSSFRTKDSKQQKVVCDNSSKVENDNFISELFSSCDRSQFEKFMSGANEVEVSLIFGGFQFVCSHIGGKPSDLTCFSLDMINLLLTCTTYGLVVTRTVIAQLQKTGNQGQGKLTSGKKSGVKPETMTSVNQTLLMISFKKLLLTYHLLQSCNSSSEASIWERLPRDTVEFESDLQSSSNILPAKSLSLHRNNCAYICSKLAGHYMRQVKDYTLAVLLNSVVLRQLRLSGSDQTKVPINLLIECYTALSQWQEAVQIIVEAAILDKDLTSCVELWVDLKRDALEAQQDEFVQRTLCCVIGHEDKERLDLVEMLLLEYRAWRRISRRNYRVEFYILSELVDRFDTGLRRYIYMIELAKNMCITGLVYNHRTPVTILDAVIDKLEYCRTESQAVLALAYFTKYVVVHEDTIMNLNTKSQEETTETTVKVDETGDTNQNTQNKGTTNQKSSDKTISLEPTNKGSCFTLATEKPYLTYLHKAVELWEKSLGSSAVFDGIDLDDHIEAIVACGTRLLAIKQPSIALRVLRVAQRQIPNLKKTSYSNHLEDKLAKVLMLLGRYSEAENLIMTDDCQSQNTTSRLLLKAELYLLMGKKQEGVELLSEMVGQGETGQLTKSLCLTSGCAKRLLSMFLCLPGDHVVSTHSQYLLTLANDAVRRHISLLRLVNKPEFEDRKSDSVEKWTSILETLQSLLHLCQLYRLIGLPRNALCYLREGLRISKAQGLPRWACEFLIEILRVQSLADDGAGAMDTINGINVILDSRYSPQLMEGNTSLTRCYQEELSGSRRDQGSFESVHSMDTDGKDSPGCFGFDHLTITPDSHTGQTNTTPGKDVNDSNSCKNLNLSEISLPQCHCLVTGSPCSDTEGHRLYSEAVLVISEFLNLSDNKTKAWDILKTLLGDDSILIDFNKIVSNKVYAPQNVKTKLYGTNNDVLAELAPSLKFFSLEANCIMAEAFSEDKRYEEVQKIWQHVKSLEKTGFFIDVLHSNILIARLALCEATSFLQSFQSTMKDIELDVSAVETKSVECHSPCNPELTNQDSLTEKTTDTDISVIEDKFEDLTLSKRKVTFGDKDEVYLVQDSKLKSSQQKGRSSRKKIFSDKSDSDLTGVDANTENMDLMTPKKNKSGNKLNSVFCTPKNQKPLGSGLHTPWSVQNRKMDLDRLLQDSDDDDMPVFPDLKPVTPRSDMPKSKKAAKSKTEPKKSRQKIACMNKSIVCDLGKTYREPCTPNENNKIRTARDIADKEKDLTNTSNKHQTNIEMISLEGSLSELESEGPKSAQRNDRKVYSALTKGKKGLNSKLVFEESSEEKENDSTDNKMLNHDVFDFEASPVTDSNKRGQKNKSSKTNTKSKVPVDKKAKVPVVKKLKTRPGKEKKITSNNVIKAEEETQPHCSETSDLDQNCTSVSVTEDNGEEEVLNTRRARRKPTNTKTTASKRPTRGKKSAEEMEVPRTDNPVCDPELNISVDDLDIMSDSDDDVDSIARGIHHVSIRLQEIISETETDSESEASSPQSESLDLEPIEILRGGRNPKTGKVRGRAFTHRVNGAKENSSKGNSSYSEHLDLEPIEILRGGRKPCKGKGRGRTAKARVEENSSEDSEGGVEEMRSSKMPSSLDLSRSLNCVDASARSNNSSGTSSPNQQDIISSLENVYEQIRRLAPYPQHSDICQILALHHLRTNPRRAAFLLSDSIAVTFRHQAMLNLNKKVRQQKTDLQGYVDGLFFNKDETNLQDMIDSVPSDWVVVQVSVVNHGAPHQPMLLTRFARNQSPVVVQVPGFASPQGRKILSNFSSIIEKSQEVMKVTVKADWWKIRRDLDSDMETLVEHMEKFWLGHWRGLLSPRQYSERRCDQLVRDIKRQTKIEIELCHVDLLLHSVEHLKDRELHKCASELLGSGCSSSTLELILGLVKEASVPEEKTAGGHVVLILDKSIQHLPWECVPILRGHSVSRMPCLSHLYTQLNYLHSQESSIFNKGVNPESTYYMVNPDSDLPKSQSMFQDWFQSEKGWKGIVGQPPTREQFAEAITDPDLFIYVGHGSGGRYFHGDDIEKLQGRAAIILMGCSSGKLSVKGQLEPSGMMISYYLAGCPCMVANLWDVTDGDIDKYLQELLTTWLASDTGTLLSTVVQQSRQACKMKYLVGCAPVVYGLPVGIKKA